MSSDCSLLHDEGCQMCGKALRGRQRRWCSRKCEREHRAQHRWTQAKNALKRDRAMYQCEWCLFFFDWADIDVDHIEPCMGRHNQWGCWHHRSNLRLVCKDCHKIITRKQHEEGKFK